MGRLLIIRHGQASFLADDYDQLSNLGFAQSEALGKYFRKKGLEFDRIIRGPLLRHQQTVDFTAKAFGDGGKKWKIESFPEFDEHQGPQLVQQVLKERGLLPKINHLDTAKQDLKLIKKQYFSAFQSITRQWLQKNTAFDTAAFESWEAFRNRVSTGLSRLQQESNQGDTIAVFTSGGPVAAALGVALGLKEEKILEMSWIVQNTSVSEFLFTKERFSLKSFNLVAHLSSLEQTLV